MVSVVVVVVPLLVVPVVLELPVVPVVPLPFTPVVFVAGVQVVPVVQVFEVPGVLDIVEGDAVVLEVVPTFEVVPAEPVLWLVLGVVPTVEPMLVPPDACPTPLPEVPLALPMDPLVVMPELLPLFEVPLLVTEPPRLPVPAFAPVPAPAVPTVFVVVDGVTPVVLFEFVVPLRFPVEVDCEVCPTPAGMVATPVVPAAPAVPAVPAAVPPVVA